MTKKVDESVILVIISKLTIYNFEKLKLIHLVI